MKFGTVYQLIHRSIKKTAKLFLRGIWNLILNKIVFTFAVIASLYFGSVSIALKYFLPEIVFKKIPDVASNETSRTVVTIKESHTLIRRYGSDLNSKCIIFFPGQHGGVLRYELEIFNKVTEKGITVYSLSYPGFEGAEGKSTFRNIEETSLAAVKFINRNTSCKNSNTVYVGRSLGASVALLVAENLKPRGILLDSVSLSLARAIRIRFKSSIYTKPLNILPVEKIIEQDTPISNSLDKLIGIPIVIFQGKKDEKTPISDIKPILTKYTNISLNPVANGKHENTHILAGLKYFDELTRLTDYFDIIDSINSPHDISPPN